MAENQENKSGQLNWWERNMPWIIGGANEEEMKQYNAQKKELEAAQKQAEANNSQNQEQVQVAEQQSEAQKQGKDNPGWYSEYAPTVLGGWDKDELQQGKAFKVNTYQKYMPTWLGGLSAEEISKRQQAAEQAGYVSRPNFYERHMPSWLGGASQEEMDKYHQFAQSYGIPERPNTWERYMPTWLGGAKKEDVDAYDNAMAAYNGPAKPNMYQKYMPSWLGGWSSEELKKNETERTQFMQNKEINREVLRGVTLGELHEAGFSNERIEELQKAVNATKAQYLANETASNAMGLQNRFGRVSQQMSFDAQEHGFSKEEARVLYQLSQNGPQNG